MKQPTNTIRPIIPNNVRPFRITAAAGTKLAGTSSLFYVNIHYQWKNFTTDSSKMNLYCLLHLRNITGSSFRSLSKIPHCRLKAWTLFQFQCGWSSSQTN